jgi:thiol-disulfide isomerase/thioredoxin
MFNNKNAAAIQVFKMGADVSGYTFTLLSGEKINMSDYVGKKCVIIEFWADYCTACSGFMQTLESFYSAGAFPDVQYLGLACEWGLSFDRAVNYVKSNNITFPQIWIKKGGKEFTVSKEKRLVSSMEYSLPKRVFVDKTGHVIVEDREKLNDEDEIKKRILEIILKCSDNAEKLM